MLAYSLSVAALLRPSFKCWTAELQVFSCCRSYFKVRLHRWRPLPSSDPATDLNPRSLMSSFKGSVYFLSHVSEEACWILVSFSLTDRLVNDLLIGGCSLLLPLQLHLLPRCRFSGVSNWWGRADGRRQTQTLTPPPLPPPPLPPPQCDLQQGPFLPALQSPPLLPPGCSYGSPGLSDLARLGAGVSP